VKNLVLFHHAPEYSDAQLDQISAQARELFANAIVASEGVEICLGAGLESCSSTAPVPEMAPVLRKRNDR
jgi:hypothetical protein